jgi:hypothetical protein
MKLYEFAPTRSIRVRWTLQELGAEFESVTVNMIAGEHRKPEFLKINPAGKLPVLVDGNLSADAASNLVRDVARIPGGATSMSLRSLKSGNERKSAS